MEEELVLCARDGGVGLVTLNRPDKRNAVNREMSRQLTAVLRELDADASIKAVVITGAGDTAFCAGADMSERNAGLSREPRAEEGASDSREGASSGISALGEVQKPVIAAINGFAYGGGARLALGADIRFGSPNAKFRFVGANYGIVTCAALLPGLVGQARAAELVFSARPVEADEAARIGLLNAVYPQEQLLPASMEMARLIAANSTDAVVWAKRVVRRAAVEEAAVQLEGEANRKLSRSAEHGERFQQATDRIVGRQA